MLQLCTLTYTVVITTLDQNHNSWLMTFTVSAAPKLLTLQNLYKPMHVSYPASRHQLGRCLIGCLRHVQAIVAYLCLRGANLPHDKRNLGMWHTVTYISTVVKFPQG